MGAESTGKMRETFHLILIISSLGIILLAAVAMPHATRVAEGGSFVHLVPHQRRQQLLNAVEEKLKEVHAAHNGVNGVR